MAITSVPGNISIQSLIEESVISALSNNGINVSSFATENTPGYDPYTSSTQRHVFLRDAVYYELLDQYSYSPSFSSQLSYQYDPVTNQTSYDEDFLLDIVRTHVKNRMIQETGRMEIDAQKEFLSKLLNGKNIIEDVREVISPGAKNFSKLTGAKVSKGNEEAYRSAVTNFIFPGTDKSLSSAVETTDKIRGKDNRPKQSPATGAPTPLREAGQSIRSVALDILESKSKASPTNSPYMTESLRIKKDYENDPVIKAAREKIEVLRKEYVIRGRAAVDRDIEGQIDIIHQATYGSPRVRGAAPVVMPGSYADRMAQESTRLYNNLVDTLPAGRRPIGTITPKTEYLLFGGGYGTTAHDVWEVNPDARLKLIEFTHKRDKYTSVPFLRDYYNGQILKYQAEISSPSGRTREAMTYKFSPYGSVEVTDKLRSRYDRAIKNLSDGLYKLDVPTELNKFRIESSQVSKEHIEELLQYYIHLDPATLTPAQRILIGDLNALSAKFEAHSQALSILEGMRFVRPDKSLEYGRLKNAFLNNIDQFETDPARKAQIIAAIKSNNYLALRALITSGAGGTSTDKKTEDLYKEFQRIADEVGKIGMSITDPNIAQYHKSFLLWANKIGIDNNIIKSFIFKRHVDNAIYAVQLMTNPKYLKQEIKTHFQREVVRRLGNAVNARFGLYISKNPILEKFVDLTYKTLGDPNFRKDPKKFLKENGKKLLISTLKEVVNKTDFYKKYAIQKILGVEVEIDFVDLIFDPKVTLKAIAKKIAITHLSNILNNLLRRTLENSFRRYLAIKRLAWRIINRFKNRVAIAASNFATRYMGAIGVRIAQWIASAAGLAVPGVGWIVTAVLTILPIILRPILGDKDLGQIFKDFMKFLLLGPCLFMFFIYFTIVLPIVTLFGNFFTDLWHAITGEGSNYYFNDERFNEALLTDRTFGGIRGSYGSYNLGDEMISGLVTTSGNSCIDELKRPKHAAKAMNKWNNLKPNDFQGITGPAEVNCRVMCNAQKSMATLFPGIPSDSGLNLLNCSATEVGQARFNPEKAYGDALQRYWCTYAVTDAYAEDFPDIATSDNASVSVLNAWFKIKITQGAPFRRIDPGQLSGQCFSKDELMSGAAIIMSGTSDCSLSDDNHAALFLKFEGNTFVYMNSNSGSLRETVDVVDCGGGKVRLNPKVYRNKKNEITLTLNFCSFYQIDSTKFNTAGKTCPTNCVPDVNNYKYE